MTKALKVTLTDSDLPARPSLSGGRLLPRTAGLARSGQPTKLFAVLNHFDGLGIDYTIRTHPPAPTPSPTTPVRCANSLNRWTSAKKRCPSHRTS